MFAKQWGRGVVAFLAILLGACEAVEAREGLARGVYTFQPDETREFIGGNICKVCVTNQGSGDLHVRVVKHEKKGDRTIFDTVVGQDQAFTRTDGLGKWPWLDYTVYVSAAKGETTAFIEIETE